MAILKKMFSARSLCVMLALGMSSTMSSGCITAITTVAIKKRNQPKMVLKNNGVYPRTADTDVRGVRGVYSLYRDDPKLVEYVSGLGRRLAEQSGVRSIKWRFGIIDSPVVNSLSLPTGQVFVTRGLLQFVRNEAELLAVLGHEVAHVLGDHLTAKELRLEGEEVGLGISKHRATRQRIFDHTYLSRHELQASRVALGYLEQLGYSGTEAKAAMDVLPRLDSSASSSAEDSWAMIPGWAHTHTPEGDLQNQEHPPESEGVQAAVSGEAEANYAARIENVPTGHNANNGYFVGKWFVHPVGGYKIVIPEQWHTVTVNDQIILTNASDSCVITMLPSKKPMRSSIEPDFLKDLRILGGERWSRRDATMRYDMTGFGSYERKTQGVVGSFASGGRNRIFVGYAKGPRWRGSCGRTVVDTFESIEVFR